ncbi:hypothetical protein M0R45_019150 [Rubus argutus]|uniref:Prolamin-like domain-containing protein n=1 Tax=Rubus argutus TaxID=59490 RepID=A0AAW1X5Y0_RUBAR
MAGPIVYPFLATAFSMGGKVSDNCCRDLVALGRLCHDIIVNKTLAVYHPSANKAQALAKSGQVWNRCAAISLSPASSPSHWEN